jgi:hypothetical protein
MESFTARCRRWIEEITVPSVMLNASMPGIVGSTGWERSNAWIIPQ